MIYNYFPFFAQIFRAWPVKRLLRWFYCLFSTSPKHFWKHSCFVYTRCSRLSSSFSDPKRGMSHFIRNLSSFKWRKILEAKSGHQEWISDCSAWVQIGIMIVSLLDLFFFFLTTLEDISKSQVGNSLAVQWLGLCVFTAVAWVQSWSRN